MPRPKSTQRYYFDADLPRIVERMKRERLTYVDLAIEYGMSLQSVKAAVRDSPYSLAIRRARKARRAEGRQNKKPAAS